MFVQSEKFVTERQGRVNDISIYGQESNQTTWRLCKMNLAIRGIDSSQVRWNNEGSFLNDGNNKDLKKPIIFWPILRLTTVIGEGFIAQRRTLAMWRTTCWQRKLRLDSTLSLSLGH